ncbi:hypothetical protein E2986_13284 [Frieseomelitta varia]|uniref:Uncharacterized protein n=1 Tax=Frieseomelitta varia TaxID=561572 RepID=A0A833S6A6_9HYME|nr:hypothetical protein E2986_13284 [Frieseomelitta varia]
MIESIFCAVCKIIPLFPPLAISSFLHLIKHYKCIICCLYKKFVLDNKVKFILLSIKLYTKYNINNKVLKFFIKEKNNWKSSYWKLLNNIKYLTLLILLL